MPPLAEENGADDNAGEGRDPDRSQPALRQRLAEDGHAGDDRQRVRQQRGDARRGQGTSVLEAGLEDEGSERVGSDERRDEGEVAVCRVDGALRRDVPGGEQEAGGDAVRRGSADTAAEQLDRDECGDGRRPDPETDAQVAGPAALTVTAGQRDAEQDQSGDGNHHSEPFVPRERHVRDARDQQRQDADPARRRRLDDRQRRKREREHEERPADRLDRKAEYPSPAPEQVPQRRQRRPDRQRWKLADGAVLEQVADVERARGGERRDEGQGELHECTIADAVASDEPGDRQRYG